MEKMDFDFIKKCWNYIVNNIKWTVLIAKVSNGSMIFDNVFSDEDLDYLKNKMKSTNGFKIEEILRSYLSDVLESNDIDFSLRNEIIETFLELFIEGLKTDFPEVYQEYILENVHKVLTCKNKGTKLNDIKDFSFNLDEFNFELKSKSSKNYNLDFFKLDDPLVDRELNKAIKTNGSVFLKYYCPTECLFRVLNFLKEKNRLEDVYVVTYKEYWDFLSTKSIKNKILISNFIFDECSIIEGNVNIFIVDDNSNLVNRKAIDVRRRTAINIEKSLEQIGYDYESAKKLLTKTNGLFVPLNMYICDKKVIPLNYRIEEKDIDVLSTLILFKSFTLSDIEEISKAFGFDSNLVERTILKYSSGINPLIIFKQRYNASFYIFSCYDDAWEQLSKNLTQKQIDLFLNFGANCLNKEIKASMVLCKSILNSYGTLSYLNPKILDRIIENIKLVLANIKINNDWDFFIQLINDLTDVNPKLMLDFLSNSFKNHEKIYDFFSNDIYVPNILWSIDQMIQCKETALEAIDFLCLIHEENFKYHSNNPHGSLVDLFCTWFNFLPTPYSKTKSAIAEGLLKKYPKFWYVLNDDLFNRKTNIIGNIYPYKYAQETITNTVYKSQVFRDANSYASLCISYAKQAEQIIDILDEINYLNDELFLKLKNTISSSNSFTDTDRMKIKEKVGREIHRNRFFIDADWAMPEERLIKLEEFYHSITFDRKEYEYHYLFLNDWDDFGLNPIPYKNPDYQNKNEQIRESLRIKGINEFKHNNLSLEFLLSLYETDNTCIGFYIAKYYDNGVINDDTLDLLFRIKNSYVAIRYCSYFASLDFSLLNDIVSKYRLFKNYSVQTLSAFIKTYKKLDDKIINLVTNNPEIYSDYFKTEYIYFVDDKTKMEHILWALDCIYKSKNYYSFISNLNHYSKFLNDEILYNQFIKLGKSGFRNSSMFEYYVSEISKRLKQYVGDDYSKIQKMALVEIHCYSAVNSRELYFLNRYLATDATLYASCVKEVFGSKSKYKDIAFTITHWPSFCPGIFDNEFHQDIFDNWIREYKEFCEKNNFKNYQYAEIGKLFAHSTADQDGIIPVKHIRKFIEQENNEEINRSFMVAEFNKRGVYTPDSGVTENRMAVEYLEMSKSLENEFPICSSIYKSLSESYFSSSERERIDDEI